MPQQTEQAGSQLKQTAAVAAVCHCRCCCAEVSGEPVVRAYTPVSGDRDLGVLDLLIKARWVHAFVACVCLSVLCCADACVCYSVAQVCSPSWVVSPV